MTETIEVATIIERLRDAQENSTQSIMGSDIFEEAADCLEALSEAVDGLGEQIVEAKKNAIYWRDNSTGLHEQLNVGESKLEPSQMLVREIVAYFDMLENMGRKPLGGPDYWPTDWLRRAKESLK